MREFEGVEVNAGLGDVCSPVRGGVMVAPNTETHGRFEPHAALEIERTNELSLRAALFGEKRHPPKQGNPHSSR